MGEDATHQTEGAQRRRDGDEPDHQRGGDPQPPSLPVDPPGVADDQNPEEHQQEKGIDDQGLRNHTRRGSPS